jgi:putative hydrolase of the HAD superfamily
MMSDLEPTETELRRAARERALELLYEAEIKGLDVQDVLDGLPLPPAPLALELVHGVQAHAEQIDELLTRRVAPRWSLARLAAVDRAILRLGTYELLGANDRSQAVILNEAVVLARRFGTDDSPRFVNGVLSAIATEARPQAPAKPEDTTPTRQADALIVDLDGVIRHWDNDALTTADRQLGLPRGTIAKVAFDPERLGRAMRGEMNAGQWAAEIGAAVAEAHGVYREAVTVAFSQVGWRIDERVMELVDQVREQVPVALLSNASSRLSDDLRRSGILDRFDAVVGSADIGVCKPEREAFLAATERLGVAPERCMFVDDVEDNVAGASAVGMQARRFRDVDELATDLIEAGLLLP